MHENSQFTFAEIFTNIVNANITKYYQKAFFLETL